MKDSSPVGKVQWISDNEKVDFEEIEVEDLSPVVKGDEESCVEKKSNKYSLKVPKRVTRKPTQ